MTPTPHVTTIIMDLLRALFGDAELRVPLVLRVKDLSGRHFVLTVTEDRDRLVQ
jgi:hypothetical protein